MTKVIFVCDGCGAQEEGFFGRGCEAHKPEARCVRRDEDGVQIACSRECIKRIAETSGKTDLVRPV